MSDLKSDFLVLKWMMALVLLQQLSIFIMAGS
jgi:hypothetical protein